MSCYNPAHMAVVDLITPGRALTHKQRFKEIGWQVNIEHHRAYKYVCPSVRDLSVEQIFKQYPHKLIETPCGNCIGCRLDYSKDWATRADMEASQYKFNWFITLTYDDQYLNYSLRRNPTLIKEHAQKFIKTLRNYFKKNYKYDGIRYLMCGEYGGKTMRPHYHLILFNCPLADLTPYFKNENGTLNKHLDAYGKPYLYSEIVANAWHKKGHILISECSWFTSAYVAQYVVKKQKGEGAEVYKTLGVQPPFILMSNRPGIGYQSFINQKGKYEEFPLIYVGRPGKQPLQTSLPRYFRKKIVEDPLFDYETYSKANEEHAEHKRSLMSSISTVNQQRILAEAAQASLQRIRQRDKTD